MEIGDVLDRSPAAARQLASRGRRRVRTADPTPDADPSAQREVVEAFLAASRDGDFDALVAVLDPDIVLRADTGDGPVTVIRGAEMVARQATSYAQLRLVVKQALVNGVPGWVTTLDGELFSIGAFVVRGGRIAEMDILADPARLARLDLAVLE